MGCVVLGKKSTKAIHTMRRRRLVTGGGTEIMTWTVEIEWKGELTVDRQRRAI